MSQSFQTHHIHIDPAVSSMFPNLILSLEKWEPYQISLLSLALTSNQLTSVANSAPHTSAAWPSPSSAVFLSYLRLSSFLTWTTAQEPHWSPFLHHHLFKSIIFTTSREDFSHIHTRSHHYSAPDFTESCLFFIYLIKWQHVSRTLTIWPLPVPRTTSPNSHASHSIPKPYNFLWRLGAELELRRSGSSLGPSQ